MTGLRWRMMSPTPLRMISPTPLVLLIVCLSFVHKVHSQQKIVVHPQEEAVTAGNTAILKCKVANKAGHVQWVRDRFGLGIDRSLSAYPRYSVIGQDALGEYNLMIVNTSLVDDASYECQMLATSDVRGVRSKPAQLTVYVPPNEPKIDSNPIVKTKTSVIPIVTVTAGTPYNITCRCNYGKPAPNVTWWVNGNRQFGSEYETITTESTGKLRKLQNITAMMTIVPTKLDQNKVYECRADNPALESSGPLKTTAILHVLYKPVISMSVSPPTKVRQYESMEFECNADANPKLVTWKWYRNGTLLPSETGHKMMMRAERKHNRQTVSCEATNPIGISSKEYRLNIEYGPVYRSQPQNVNADVGSKATLVCDVDGNPTPQFVWTKKGFNTILGDRMTLTFSDRPLANSDFSAYICEATVMGIGNIITEIHLLKNGPPKVTSEIKQYAEEGDTALIECVADSIPKPQNIAWKRGRKAIVIDGSSRFTVREEDHIKGRKSVLTIANIHAADYGDYNCSVKNKYGEDYAVINLIQKVMPVKSEQQDAVPLPYVLGGVLGGVAVIIIIVIVLVIYNRRKARDEDSTADTNSTDSANKKNLTDVKVEYKSTGTDYSGPLESWRNDYNKDRYRSGSSDQYDELANTISYPYTNKDGRPYINGYGGNYDYQDGGQYEIDRMNSDRLPPYDRSYDSGFEPDVYPRQYGRPAPPIPNDVYSSNDVYGQPPMTATVGRLSTNV
nr:kirrel [Terebratalia transversa]